MSTLSLRLPDSLHRQVRLLARREGISINQLIASAAAEKVTALMTEEYLTERSKRGTRERFDAVLGRVPDVPPSSSDLV